MIFHSPASFSSVERRYGSPETTSRPIFLSFDGDDARFGRSGIYPDFFLTAPSCAMKFKSYYWFSVREPWSLCGVGARIEGGSGGEADGDARDL